MATTVKQGQTIAVTATEVEIELEGYDPRMQLPAKLIVVSGTFRYTTAIRGVGNVLGPTYASVTTAGTTRDCQVPIGHTLRLQGVSTATVEITW